MKGKSISTYLFYGILLVIFVLPLERIGSIDVLGFTLRISQLLVLAIFMVWLFHSAFNKNIVLHVPYPFVLYALFIAGSLLSLLYAHDTGRGIVIAILITFMLLVGYVLTLTITSKDRLRVALYALLLSAALFSIFGLLQFAGDMVGLPQSVTGLSDRYTRAVLGFPRIQSTFIEPLYFANYLLTPLMLTVVFFLRKTYGVSRAKLVLLFIIMLITLILTVSKGGIAAFAVLVVIALVLQARKVFDTKNLITMFTAGVAVVIGVAFIGSSVLSMPDIDRLASNAFDTITGASISERAEAYRVAVDAFESSPVIGIGLGNFGPYFSGYPTTPPDFGWPIVNNQYLEILAETGMVGLVLFLVFLIAILYRSFVAYFRTRDEFLKTSILALSLAFLGVFIQYATFSTLYIMHVWVLIGLLLSTQSLAITSSNSPNF